MCGLCGNFDGIQNNDFTSSNLKVEEDPVDFGNSWKVSPQCADTRKVGLGSPRGWWVVGLNCSGGGAQKEGLGSFWVDCLGPSVYSCLDPQVPLDSSPATCHNNIMKQTMVDSSCRILTSDIFRDCNKLVRAVGGGRYSDHGHCLGAFETTCIRLPRCPLSWLQAGKQKGQSTVCEESKAWQIIFLLHEAQLFWPQS